MVRSFARRKEVRSDRQPGRASGEIDLQLPADAYLHCARREGGEARAEGSPRSLDEARHRIRVESVVNVDHPAEAMAFIEGEGLLQTNIHDRHVVRVLVREAVVNRTPHESDFERLAVRRLAAQFWSVRTSSVHTGSARLQ
jgi:hypothetical protein